MGSNNNKDSLFQRIGGEPAILLAVNVFYEKLSTDDDVSHFFENLDLDKLAKKQASFMSMAFGGPVDNDVRDLTEAHANLNLTDHHFDVVAGHLADTLKEIGVAPDLQEEVLNIVEGTRDAVLGRV